MREISHSYADDTLYISAFKHKVSLYRYTYTHTGATTSWLAESLALTWRQQLTLHLQTRYLSHRHYLHLLNAHSPIDNPDQRITQDVSMLCMSLGQIAKVLVAAPLSILYYAYLTHGYVGPSGVLMALTFFILGAFIQRPLMNRIAHYVYNQERLEGDFRAQHMRVRAKSESIAIMRAEPDELRECEGRFGSLLSNQVQLIAKRWWLALLTKYLE